MTTRFRILFTLSLVVFVLVVSTSLQADSGANHQVPSTQFGVSGGNINDITRRFCCSGTLGSLIQDSAGNKYILSNNHVLARSDQAAPGEDISQPGLIDNNCQVPPIVADLTGFPHLGTNVDCAMAALRPNTMNPGGPILDIGNISSNILAASVGLNVEKSGRTTGFTTGTVSAVNASVNVQYQRECGKGKKFVVSYTNQVVINSSTFSAGGDSGSLIVSNSASCPRPVALLFAGSSTTTIGNPIGEVISKLGAATGTSLSFVGTNCTASVEKPLGDDRPNEAAVEFATTAMRSREEDLLSRPGVIGVGVGSMDDSPTEAAIVVYVDQNASGVRLPRRINGLRVKVVRTEPFVAR
jgi:Peptidase family S64